MLDALEALSRSASHPLGGAVGGLQLRVGALQLEQFAVKPVVDRILHLGSIQYVIGMGGAVEQGAQFGSAQFGSAATRGRVRLLLRHGR